MWCDYRVSNYLKTMQFLNLSLIEILKSFIYSYLMRFILYILITLILVGCSDSVTITKSEQDNDNYYLFDGNYNLSQNWNTATDVFDPRECSTHLISLADDVCLLRIKVKDNKFTFYDWTGVRRECHILQNEDLPSTYPQIILACDDTADSVYNVTHRESDNNSFLFQKYPLSSKYKILLEPSMNLFENIINKKNFKNKSIKNLDVRSGRNNLLINRHVDIDRNKTLAVDESRMLIYADDLRISDGTDGYFAGQILGFLTCAYIGIDLDCSSIGGEIGAEATKNDGSSITQNLCISYDAIDSRGNIYDFVYICEKFTHPIKADFQSYIPKFFTSPQAKYNGSNL